MAATNKDWPRGFWPAKTKHGGPPQVTRYYTSGTSVIYRGDIVVFAAGTAAESGNLCRYTGATDSDRVVGVSQTYTTYGSAGASDGTVAAEIFVYDDLANTIFIAQCNSSATTALTCFADLRPVGSVWGIATGSPTTATDMSIMEVATSATAARTRGVVRILDRVQEPSNVYGEGYLDVYCQILRALDGMVPSTISATS